MLGRESTAAKLKAARETLATRRASLATSRKILDGIDADLDQVAARTHAGELVDLQAEKELAEVAERERVHTAAVDHLERTCALLEDEIAQLEHAGDLARHAEQISAVEELQKVQQTSSALVAENLKRLASAVGKCERARSAVDEAVARAEELAVDGCGPLPVVDEPAWMEADALEKVLAFVEAGPSRPVADGAALAAREERRRDREEAAQISDVVTGAANSLTPSADIARLLPEHLHARAFALYKRRANEHRAQAEERDRREAAQKAPRVLR